ncbi:hypothetical protein VTI74DRAFT_4990 [Chaetomium olivicolor]
MTLSGSRRSSGFRAAVPFLTLLSRFPSHVEALSSVSINSYDSYGRQIDCVKTCLWQVGTLDDLIAAIGCSKPWYNECFCNPELASKASDFITDCVASQCTTLRTAPAITSAQSAYNDYCSANGFSIPTVASIRSYSAYASQPYCVQQCLWNPGQAASDHLMPAMGCHAPWENSCLCNTASVSAAAAFLSSCITRGCSTDTKAPQVTAALSVHGAYCSAAGLPLPIAAVTTPTTDTMSQTAGNVVPGASSPAGTGEDIQQGPGLSTGAIVGIAVGGGAGFTALFAAAAFVLYRRRRARPQKLEPVPVSVPPGHTKVQHPPPWIHEAAVDLPAVEADWDAQPPRRFEMPS